MAKKRILLDIEETTHKALKKIAQNQASRFKPYAELVLKQHAENHLRQRLADAQKNDKSHTERLS